MQRGYLLFWDEYQIYVKCGEKISSTSENIDMDIFTAWDEIYLVFAEKK